MKSFRRIVCGAFLGVLLILGAQIVTAQVYTGFCVATNNGPGCWLKNGGTCIIYSGGECTGIVL